MKVVKYPRLLAISVGLVLGQCQLTAAAGSKRSGLRSGDLSFARGVEARSGPQTGGRKRSGRRKKSAPSPAKGGTTANQPPVNRTSQPALPTAQGPLSQVQYELPIRKPRAGESQERGLLERVDCNGNVATFIVHVGARVLKLHAANFNAVQYRTYTPDVSGDITCGARNPASNVVVTFRPASGASARFDGDIIAVEFVPKDFELKR